MEYGASVGCTPGVEAEVKAGDKADDKLAESGRKGLHNCELPALKKGAGYFLEQSRMGII